MGAAEVAERAIREAFAPGVVDPGAVANQAVGTAKTVPARAMTTSQRGRTGKVSWDPNQHKRGYHGRFAAGGGGQQAQQQRQLHDQGLYHGAIDAVHGPQTQAAIKALQTKYGIKPTGKVDAETAAVIAAPPPQTAAQADKQIAALNPKSKTAKAAAKAKRSKGKTGKTGRLHGGTAGTPGSASWQGQLSMTGVLRAGDGAHTKGGKNATRGNAEVQQMQAKLEQLGFDLGAAGTDGKFGKGTEAAVKAFQRAYGLSPDGVVGRNTKLMLNLLSQTEGAPNPNALSLDQMPLTRPPRGGGRKGAARQAQLMGVQQAEVAAADYVREHLRS